MRIAFFTLSYNTQMYKSLIKEFVNKGHSVLVVTPIYNNKSYIKRENGFEILYFKSLKVLDVNPLRKGIGNMLLPLLCIYSLRRLVLNNKFDLILLTTPTLMFYDAIRYLKNKNPKAFFYLILRDIHPEGIKRFFIMKFKLIWLYFRNIEKKLYTLSDKIGCMSPANIEFVVNKNPQLSVSKLTLLPNWEKAKLYTLDLDVKKKYNINHNFVAIYGGNIGTPQGLDVIVKLAAEKKSLKDVLFLFLGTGNERLNLERLAKELGLSNLRFMDFIPRNDYDQLMSACDIGIISLANTSSIPCIPSKALGYFNSKLPILANIDEITDFGNYIIDRIGCGLWSLTSDFDSLSSNFDVLYFNKNKRKQMGENGYEYLQKEFSVDITYEKIMKDFDNYGNNNL